MAPPRAARAVGIAAAVAVLWGILAWRNPNLTYHFAPLIGGLAGPASLRSQGRVDRTAAIRTSLVILAVLLGTTAFLVVTERMEGPNFLHSGPAWPEAVLFAAVGVAIGGRAAYRERPGLLGTLIEGSPANE